MTEGRFKLCVLSLSWNNSVHMYTCTFIHLYCKMNFKRQLSTRYLIKLPFFSTGILQLGHGLVVFLIVSLDASSHRACMAACSSTTYSCKEREKPPVGTILKGCTGTWCLHWSGNYLPGRNRQEWLQGQVGWTSWEMQSFCFKMQTYFLPVCTTCIGLDPELWDSRGSCSRWSVCHPGGPSYIQLQHRLHPPHCSLPRVAGKALAGGHGGINPCCKCTKAGKAKGKAKQESDEPIWDMTC